ncbi:hypothetical protein [Streptomyces sp. NPDC000229]|uniref:hypothetical protein n=1 Tax=Streptomyces sp. NPDC000229 TaxID=3154247 RepID=UPI003318A675
MRALDPAPAMFEAMLSGREQQQRSRLLARKTIEDRLSLVRRFALFTGIYPWEWTPEDAEAYFSYQMSGENPLAHSTVRGQQGDLQMFCAFVTDGRYGWASACEEAFGQFPVQVCHAWNTADHVAEFEGRPGRRALTYDELQALFDAADDRVEQAKKRRRKVCLPRGGTRCWSSRSTHSGPGGGRRRCWTYRICVTTPERRHMGGWVRWKCGSGRPRGAVRPSGAHC